MVNSRLSAGQSQCGKGWIVIGLPMRTSIEAEDESFYVCSFKGLKLARRYS
jgi:hypothetical protein